MPKVPKKDGICHEETTITYTPNVPKKNEPER